ncbi:MAG: pentapeptide repeat-containing protein, partial [Planctomycetaceae bacterium]|nr:pentapeptide repeat-containing protein [Planctomycetaceae bacterium]
HQCQLHQCRLRQCRLRRCQLHRCQLHQCPCPQPMDHSCHRFRQRSRFPIRLPLPKELRAPNCRTVPVIPAARHQSCRNLPGCC